jgi:hypothetical protein
MDASVKLLTRSLILGLSDSGIPIISHNTHKGNCSAISVTKLNSPLPSTFSRSSLTLTLISISKLLIAFGVKLGATIFL